MGETRSREPIARRFSHGALGFGDLCNNAVLVFRYLERPLMWTVGAIPDGQSAFNMVNLSHLNVGLRT